jgi:nucleoside 2-deoxyribosyltransferase
MNTAFIIMQIGNSELDALYEAAIVPAIESCGLRSIRVDRDNHGDLLKQEIRGFIEQADIIIADLTNERPNCYLEIGYAMGVDKFKSLILTVKADHYHRHPAYRPDGPTIHFDASGYDMVFWETGGTQDFRTRLEQKIRRRLAIITPNSVETQTHAPNLDNEWIVSNREKGKVGLQSNGMSSYMEIVFSLLGQKPSFQHHVLLEACRASQIDTFGWPIGVLLESPSQNEWRPRPTSDGIVAEVVCSPESGSTHYDLWHLRKNGDYYSMISLFEDARTVNAVYFNTRIVRVTETLLYCARLYNNLGIPNSRSVNIQINHSGLSGRELSAAGNRSFSLSRQRFCSENDAGHSLTIQLVQIENELVSLVKEFTAPLFGLFDFMAFDDNIYAEIVNGFVDGRVL